MRVLALAPHTDDVELGCGGTVARLVEEGHEVHVAAFSTAEESVPPESPRDTLEKEFLRSMPLLGVPLGRALVYHYPVRRLKDHRQEVLEELVRLRKELQPDVVFLPSANDVHQDHQVLCAEGLRAFKSAASVLGYELPWNHTTFSAQMFSVLEKSHIDKKWEALCCYQSQFELKRKYFSREFIEGLARVRGAQIEVEWAESFEVVRMKWALGI